MKLLKNTDFHSQYDMIVFCHLRWDFVYQRPQHLITRMSKNFKILVVEEPIGNVDNNDLVGLAVSESIHILKPTVDHMQELGIFLKKIIKYQALQVGWFYSAAFIDVLNYLDFGVIVYDCMDELSLFKGASSELIEQEKYLLSAADVVYTGGKSLYEAKKERHHNVYCFPSSVDQDHFDQKGEIAKLPADLELIPKPIVGYYGVIDERIDLDLLEMSALKMPDVSFVMIGPICKIGEEDLPKAKNIFYLGMKKYEELPTYLNVFDFAMMPFALNDSTKFISPTKTLEYMCAGKPIISTKIKDVVRDYSDCINLIENEEDFHNAVLNPKKDFKHLYNQILEQTSWDITASKMTNIIKEIA